MYELRDDNSTKKILVVEDDRLFQDFAKMVLSKNYIVDVAENGYDAIKLYEKNKYMAILMDIDLPDISGIEVTKIIRNLEASGDMRSVIIAVTGGGEAIRPDCIRAGMNDFIAKPFKLALLEKILARYSFDISQ
jgi:CheY-like chemotaxis protein